MLRELQLRRLLLYGGSTVLALALLAFLYFRVARPRLQEAPLPVLIENGMRKRKMSIPGWIQRWSWRARLSPFQRVFRILDHAHWILGKKITSSLTPSERVNSLIDLLPEATNPAQSLLLQYQQAEYSEHPADIQQALSAGTEIRLLAYRAFLRRHLTNRT